MKAGQWVYGAGNALPYLSIVYLLLLFFYAIQFFRTLSTNRILQTEGLTRAPLDMRLFITKTALHLGIKKKIRIWLSEHVDVPSVTGFIKPVILLPASIVNNLTIQQTEAVLLHELAHIRRNDYLVNFLQSVVELTLFFNPFAVLLSKAAKKERENCCDDWVMNFQYDQYEYAKALLVLEEQRHLQQFRFVLTATNGKKNLLQRIKRLFNTDPQTDFRPLQKYKLIGLCVFLLTGMFTVLPFLPNKPAPGRVTGIRDGKEKLKPVKFSKTTLDKTIAELSSKNIFAIPTVKPAIAGTPVTSNSIKTKQPAGKIPANKDYVNAFINEELLNPARQIEPIAVQAVNAEINNVKFFVKIEEQQSGKKQTNTYYFELNNKDGNTAIKPLVMLKKFKMPLKKIVVGNLPDSLDTSTRPNNKKRITS